MYRFRGAFYPWQTIARNLQAAKPSQYAYSIQMPAHQSAAVQPQVYATGSIGIRVVGVFLFFAALMSALAGLTLTFPGTTFDRAWNLNLIAYHRMAPFGRVIGIPFLIFSGILCAVAVGWLKRCHWAWMLTVFVIAAQIVGDALNLILADYLRGTVGVAIASLVLFCLLRPNVRAAFQTADDKAADSRSVG